MGAFTQKKSYFVVYKQTTITTTGIYAYTHIRTYIHAYIKGKSSDNKNSGTGSEVRN